MYGTYYTDTLHVWMVVNKAGMIYGKKKLSIYCSQYYVNFTTLYYVNRIYLLYYVVYYVAFPAVTANLSIGNRISP